MSIWSDIEDRSVGGQIREEEFHKIYYDNGSTKKPIETLDEDTYKDYTYMILTAGDYPILDIRVKSEDTSVFGGYTLVILKFPDGSKYEIERSMLPTMGTIKYLYSFDKEGDYVHNRDDNAEDAHIYTLEELQKYARMFIDKIIQCEDDLNREKKEYVCDGNN